jgi:hypothetical protein
MDMETVSQQPQIDERRALMMSLQAMLDLDMLKVVAALMPGERPITALADELGVPPSFSRGPLGRLIFLEIVAVREVDGRIFCRLNKQRLHALNGALQRLSRDLFASERPANAAEAANVDEADRRVLRGLLRGEQLKNIPSGERLQPVLRWLAAKFEPGRRYPEREVNELLGRHHPDFATLRRSLVDYRYLSREREVYWRVEGALAAE